MRILLVAPAQRPGFGGGQARAGSLLAASLLAHEGIVFGHAVVPHQQAFDGVVQAAAGRLRFYAGYLSQLVRLRPQVVHFFSPCSPLGFMEKATLAVLARLLKARVLINFRNDLRLYYADFAPFTRWLFRRGLVVFDGAICQFGDLASFLSQVCALPETEVFVVPNAVEPREIHLDDASLDRRFQERRIICIGSLQERKGIDTLIEAAGLLRDRGWLRHPVDIVGEVQAAGVYTALRRLRDRLALDEAVHFHGPKFGGEKRALLDRSAVLVLASRREGFPNVVLEALQAGVPVVLAESGAAADIAAVFGDAVRLVPADAPPAVADAIASLLASVRDYGEFARAAAGKSSCYHPDAIRERFLAVYGATARRRDV